MKTFRLWIFTMAALALITSASLSSAAVRTTSSAPTILALLYPPDGAVFTPDARPSFGFEATPGGRFRVEFSSTRAPFIPVLNSGRRTTPGDQYKPNAHDWRDIVALGAATPTVFWRVVALGMTADEVNAAPIASFTIQR